jgi:diguanylate cyclase (GGDEF)-like protein
MVYVRSESDLPNKAPTIRVIEKLGLVQSDLAGLIGPVEGGAISWATISAAKFSVCLIFVAAALFRVLPLYPSLAILGFGVFIDVLIIGMMRNIRSAKPAPHHIVRFNLLCAFLSGATCGAVAGSGLGPVISLVAWGGLAFVAAVSFGSQRLALLSFLMGSAIPVLSITGNGVAALLIGAALAVCSYVTILRASREWQDRWAVFKASEGGTRAERLLQEYENAGRGWFWETDRSGRLTYISQALGDAFQTDSSALVGQSFFDLVHSQSDDQDGGRTLNFYFSARTPFNEIAVRTALSSDERWWAVSGQPVFNEFGTFFGFRGSGFDLTEIRRSQAEITRLAQFDSLTGLANRRHMTRLLDDLLNETRGQTRTCGLFLLDLDRFKSVNDTLGHPAGDALLEQVSQRIARCVGDKGVVGRLGGDEFEVILPDIADRAALSRLATEIIALVSQPYSVNGSIATIGTSIGIAISPDDSRDSATLVRNADLALYAAKDDGRGLHRFYQSVMHAGAEDRRQLEQELRQAIAGGQLYLVYQPVVSAATETVTGFEALVRWKHPTKGLVSPAAFIPLAEDTGLIGPIGEWVLRTACHEAVKWPSDVRIAVNISPIQFADPHLPALVMSALANAQLGSDRLELEITEGVFLNDSETTDAMFQALKQIGVRLALDDFGTGYSSLGYLRKAPFDKIKIDRSFVAGASINGSRNKPIIRAIVGLAEALGMETTAEGAETQDELDLIRSLGCSHIQGYIYGKPMTGGEALEKLADRGGVVTEGFKVSREPRKSLLRTVAITNGHDRYTARIRNISATGALIEGLWNVPPDTVFSIELTEYLSVKASARWSTEDRTGVEFATAVDLSLFGAQQPGQRLASAKRA